MSEPATLSLTEVATAVAQKRVSSREVTQSCLARIGHWQPRLNAFMAIEADDALAAADAADAALAKGRSLGALHGVPTPVNALLQRLALQAAAEGRPPGSMTVEHLHELAGIPLGQ